MKAIKTCARTYRLGIDFRHALRRVPRRDRPGLRHWLRSFALTTNQLDPGVAPARHTRTFYILDPATGHWRRL